MRRAALSAILLVAALVLQLTGVNRLSLPGSGAPDLVLLTVVALGLCGSPAVGAVTGFCAGLGLDLAPPGSYLIGEYALVFCLIGYLCGRLRGLLNQSALLTIALAMVAAAAGEAAIAALGLVVSDPQVSWSAVRQVLPSSAVYDAAVSPFLLYGVMRAVGWADGLGRGTLGDRQADGPALLARGQVPGGVRTGYPAGRGTALGGAGLLGGAGWLAGPVGSGRSAGPRVRRGGARNGTAVHLPRTPRLRAAAARPGDGWLGGGPRTGLSASVRRGPGYPGYPARPPRFRPGSGSPGSAAARSAWPPAALPKSSPNLRLAAQRRRAGNPVRGLGPGAGPGASALSGRRSGPPGSAFRGRPPGTRPATGLSGPGASPRGPRFRPGASPRGPRFRPGARLPGGSSSAGMRPATSPGAGGRRGGRLPAIRPARGVSLRLRTGRRHDGVLGGGGTLGLSGLRGGGHRGRAPRPASLRLGSARRGDGTLGGGVLGHRAPWTRPRLGARRATPRFRPAPGAGGRPLLGRRTRLGARQRARFSPGRTSLLASLTHGRLGRRSTVWRIGSRRTGGLR